MNTRASRRGRRERNGDDKMTDDKLAKPITPSNVPTFQSSNANHQSLLTAYCLLLTAYCLRHLSLITSHVSRLTSH
jgi:hypothetical protein